MNKEGHPGAHADDETLELYARRRLNGPRLVTLEEHLLLCGPCRAALERNDEYVAVMRAALLREAGQLNQSPDSLLWLRNILHRPVWVAAVAACLLFAMWLPLRTSRPQSFIAVSLMSARGLEQVSTVKSGVGLDLDADLTELPFYPSYGLAIADSLGKIVWQAACPVTTNRIRAHVEKSFRPGNYWVRVYAPGSQEQLLREYALRVE